MTPLLVIGYGNELRGDDGVGPRVARMVTAWNRENVRGLAMHQLTPELAAELAKAERVVFVDASADADEVVCWWPIRAEEVATSLGHVVTPGMLFGMSKQVFGRAPEAWLVTIPARDLGYGAALSLPAACDMRTVLRQIAGFARGWHYMSERVVHA